MKETAAVRFDCAQLAHRIDRIGRGEVTALTGIGEARLGRLLRGETDFRHREILALSRLLNLSASEMRSCFFTPESSEILNYSIRSEPMIQLYSSNHFALTEIRSTGKKDTRGILCFEGLPSVFGSAQEVLALEDGVVLTAGRCQNAGSRDYRRGTVIVVSGRNGVSVTYGRLAHRYVGVGDYVRAGQPIGIQGSTGAGTGEYLTLEFRRNGRRVDGCEYLGIPAKPREFTPPDCSPAEVVTRACGLTEGMRVYLDRYAESDLLWERLYRHLAERSV